MEKAARTHLCSIDRHMQSLVKRIGPLGFEPRLERSPFQSLVQSIAHQQLHGTAAESILRRFCALFPDCPFPRPEEVLRKRAATLRKAGFSEAKVLAIRDLAEKARDGVIPSSRELAELPDGDIIERLTQVRGIGRWTAEMLLIFQLGRPDVFPVDDFGVRRGHALTYSPRHSLTRKQFQFFAERYAPFRSYAALYFWRATDEK